MARRVEIAELKEVLATFGFREMPEEADGLKEIGLQPYRCGDDVREMGKPEFTMALEGHHQQGVALLVPMMERVGPRQGAMFVIEQFGRDDEVIGGVGVLVLGAERRRPERDTLEGKQRKSPNA